MLLLTKTAALTHLAEGKFLHDDEDDDDDDNDDNTQLWFLSHIISCVYIQNTILLKHIIRTVQEKFIAEIIQNT